MLLFRPALFVAIVFLAVAVLCWGMNVSAQTMPVQPFQPQPMQTQPMQAPPMQAPHYTPPSGSYIYQHPNPPMRMAQSVPLYDSGGTNRTATALQPGAGQETPQGVVHANRAEPAPRVVPFLLNPGEQRELDEFLARWERISANISRYDVEFDMFEYDPTIPGAVPNQPQRRSFGYFKYIANPRRFLYVIEGEYNKDGKKTKWDDKNPHINAEKIIIDEKTVSKFDYNAKTVHQVLVPPEMIGKGIADSPLPLIFGARADELKRRFSMKIVAGQNGMLQLNARPLLIEDQGEFKELEIFLAQDLRARGLRQWDVNDKTHKTFVLTSVKINDKLGNIVGDIATIFRPSVPFGWKSEVHRWDPQPPPAPAIPQTQLGNPAPPPQQFRSEIPLY